MSSWIQYPNLKIDEASHVYTWKERPVVSVTQIFDRIGFRKDDKSPWMSFGCSSFAKNNICAEFGGAGHLLANCLALKKKVSFPKEMLQYHNKIIKFLSKYQIQPLIDLNGNPIAEYPLFHEKLGFCGTPDLCCVICGSLAANHITIIEWKFTDYYQEHYAWQTAAYSLLVREVFGGRLFDKRKKINRVVVLISADREEPREEWRSNNLEDFIIFQSLLNVYKKGQ